MRSMSLVGGFDVYRKKRHLSDIAAEGRKVVFLNANGYDSQREKARIYFEEGTILTIKEIYVSHSSSEVEFIEFPSIKFNTVMFADLEEYTKENTKN